MESKYQEKYIDVATQTSPFTSPLIAPACAASPITSFFTATSLLTPGQCTISQNFSPAEEDMHPDEPSHSDIFSPQPPLPSSPFGLQRYTGTRSLHTNNRTVSLPAHLCDEDLRLLLSQLIDNSTPEKRQQQRVVSMPMPEPAQLQVESPSPSAPADPESCEPSLEAAHSDDTCYTEEQGSVSSSSPSTPRTIIMHSLSSDHFHTPSPPPSSCDSVEFTLDDPVCLPDSFLRGSGSPSTFTPEVVNKAADLLEDDGWLTWASSPPRPIPALHGPSSLPYARCPSGAEGTIIGEPSSLPRMIWGLDPNDNIPTPHLSNSQQTRVVPIKHLADKLRHGSSQMPVSPATLPPLVPKLSLMDLDYLEDVQNRKRLSASVPAAPEIGSEQGFDGAFRGMTRVGAGLGFSVSEEELKLGTRYNAAMRAAGTMDSSQLYTLQTPNAMDEGVELLSVEAAEPGRQRQLQAQSQEERYGFVAHGMGSRGLPSNMIDLLSNPVKLPIHTNNINPFLSAALRFPSSDSATGRLLTPPNSTSPQWSSVLSPLQRKSFLATNLPFNGSGSSANSKPHFSMGTPNDELSQELRRFVFENIATPTSADTADSLRIPTAQRTRSAAAFSTPIHPPGIPIPNHNLLPQAPDSFFTLPTQGVFSQMSAHNVTSTYTRSTLSNPRSIPLSRLHQKRGALKLATVPEEDPAETYVHDSRLYAPHRGSLRTPSPLLNGLQPQSVDMKAAFGVEELTTVGKARVKLPHCVKGRADATTPVDSVRSTQHQGSPKKKRPQRRRKSGVSKLAETAKGGFPLGNEGPVLLGSFDAT